MMSSAQGELSYKQRMAARRQQLDATSGRTPVPGETRQPENQGERVTVTNVAATVPEGAVGAIEQLTTGPTATTGAVANTDHLRPAEKKTAAAPADTPVSRRQGVEIRESDDALLDAFEAFIKRHRRLLGSRKKGLSLMTRAGWLALYDLIERDEDAALLIFQKSV